MFDLIEPPPQKKFQTLPQGEFVYFLNVQKFVFLTTGGPDVEYD